MTRDYSDKVRVAKRQNARQILGTSILIGSLMFVFFVYLVFQILGMNEYY